MRRAALVALVLVAFPARGQQLYGPDSPTPIQRPYPSPQVWAPFNVAQCLPTGGIGDVTQGATITTTRASTQTVAVPNPNQTSPGLIPEDSGTVSHVVWNGSALVDTKGNAWTQNGTVPQVPASWYAPPAAGPYSAANNYSLAAGAPSAAWDFRGTDFSITAVVSTPNTSVLQVIMSKQNAGQTTGWILYMDNTGRAIFLTGGGGSVASTATLSPGKPSVVTVGRSGGNWYMRVDGSAAVSSVAGTAASASGAPLGMGLWAGPNTYPWLGQIYETLTTTTPYNDAAVGALQASVLAKIGQGTLSTCPAASLAVGVQGAEVYAAGTNLLAAGTMSDQANAAWVKSNVTVAANVGLAPDGTATADRLTVTAGGSPATSIQTVTGAGANTRTPSIWIQAGTQGTTASIALLTDGAAPTCLNVTPTSTPTRYSVTGTSTPVTNTALAIYLTANCTGNATAGDNILVSMAQHEVSAYPAPFTTGTRAATVSTVPLPDLGANWCVGVTATPGVGRKWSDTFDGFFWFGGVAVPNLFNLSVNTSSINVTVYDSASAARTGTATHGFGATGSTHRIVACGKAGVLSLFADGAPLTTVQVWAGTGVITAWPNIMYLGISSGSGFPFNGSLKDLRLYPNSTYRAGM